MTAIDYGTLGRADQLGEAVVRTLERPFRNRFSISFVRGLVLGIFTLGIGPLLGLGRRFRDYVMFERQQMWHLAEWLRMAVGSEGARELRDLAEQIRFRKELFTL